jgi:GTP-binding protein
MVIGENARSEDIDVNAIKEKQQTNVRAAAADQTVRLVPAKRLSLEQALEFLREDECVEITPEIVRLRKVELEQNARVKLARKRAKAGRAAEDGSP